MQINPINKKKEENKKTKKTIFWNLLVLSIFIFAVLNIVFISKSFEYANVIAVDQINLQILKDNLKDNSNDNSNNNSSNTGRDVNHPWFKISNNDTCPDSQGGDEESYLSIKYFYSKFCPWCIKEEAILKRLLENQGSLVNIEWYNVKNCPELVNKYKVSGVPTFVFSTPDNQTEYNHYGFIPENELIKFVCDVTGECKE